MTINYTMPDSLKDFFSRCFKEHHALYHFIPYAFVNAPSILPLCLYILVLGLRQRRSGARISHNDFFTYNMVVIQLIAIAGSCVIAVNLIFHSELIITVSVYAFLINSCAVVVFQSFTCIECYMAVVHPVTYLRLKSEPWILVRNIVCAHVWLYCVIQTFLYLGVMRLRQYIYMSLGTLSGCVALVLFCNLCVLRVLIRPGPGDGAKSSQKSKRRAFNTITAITATLAFLFVGDAICVTSFMFLKHRDDSCALWFSLMWFSLPSTLVLPLLFLHRHGKLPRFKTGGSKLF